MATAAGHRPSHLRRPRPAVALVPDRIRLRRTLPCRGGRRGPTPCPHRWPTCGRRPDTVRGVSAAWTPAWPSTPACQVCRTPAVREWSLERPFRKQRTVNPLIVPLVTTSSTLLKAGPADGRRRRPSSRRRRRDGHRGSQPHQRASKDKHLPMMLAQLPIAPRRWRVGPRWGQSCLRPEVQGPGACSPQGAISAMSAPGCRPGTRPGWAGMNTAKTMSAKPNAIPRAFP